MAILLATTSFESAMYLFVFFWSAALKSARTSTAHSPDEVEELPFGLIFACFMCAMMAGSCIFNLKRPGFQGATLVLMSALLIACVGLSSASMMSTESYVFYAFIAVETSIGLYFPAINLLKSEVVSDEIRGSTYSLMRLPLNLFVVITHSLDEEGMFLLPHPVASHGAIRGCLWQVQVIMLTLLPHQVTLTATTYSLFWRFYC